MSAVVRANVDLSGRAKTNFKVGNVLYRMTPGAVNPVTRYYVSEVLGKDVYKVQTFDSEGCLLKQSIVVTPERVSSFYFDAVATRLYDRVKFFGDGHEKSI